MSTIRTVLKSNIKWEGVQVVHANACWSFMSYMRSKRGVFIFLRLFVDECVVSLERLNVEVF